MIFFLFALWLCLNGRVTIDVLVTGVAVVGLVYGFCYRFLQYRFAADRQVLVLSGQFLSYMLLLIKEMVIANLQVIKLVLSPQLDIRPQLVHFQPDVHTPQGRVLLANSITLTPGTITADLTEEGFWVHGLHPDMLNGIEDSDFIRRIRKMEEKS